MSEKTVGPNRIEISF